MAANELALLGKRVTFFVECRVNSETMILIKIPWNPATENYSEEGDSRTVTGPDLLRAYRNARHGYAINEKDQEALLLHSGRIPDDLPDLTIALWHYLLLRFPFT